MPQFLSSGRQSGKTVLMERLIREQLDKGERVAVLSVNPEGKIHICELCPLWRKG